MESHHEVGIPFRSQAVGIEKIQTIEISVQSREGREIIVHTYADVVAKAVKR
jgi:hypothetical protein